jgi:cyclase
VRVETVGSDLSIVIGETDSSASTVFVANGDALIVDAMASTSDAEALRRYVEDDLEKRVRFVVVTHYFSDHLAALRTFPDATIVTHELYSHTFASEQHRSAEEQSFFVKPGMTFSNRMMLRWGRYTLNLFYNPGGSMSAAGIDVPEADLLFTANAISGHVAYFVYSTPDLVVKGIERLRRCGRRRILTGHGGPQDALALDHSLAYVNALNEYAAKCFAEGTQAHLADARVEDFMPRGIEATDLDRRYHRRNLDYLLSNGRFLYA